MVLVFDHAGEAIAAGNPKITRSMPIVSETAQIPMWAVHGCLRSASALAGEAKAASAAKECQQIGVQPVLVNMQQSVRPTLVNDELGLWYEFGCHCRRDFQRYNLIVTAVHHQRR